MFGDFYEGVIARAEAGTGGRELSIGYSWHDELVTGELAVKASVLDTWNDPKHAEPDQTYVGVGIDLVFLLVYVTVSHYWHVAGNDDEHDRITSVGVGIGF